VFEYLRLGEATCGSGFEKYEYEHEHEYCFLRVYLHAAAHNREGDFVSLTQYQYVVIGHHQSSNFVPDA
jgi:hypothetical protein